jgi:deoxyribodipyrimidine photolyase
MRLLSRLVIRGAQELVRNPEARAKVAQGLTQTSRTLNENVKPRARRAWQEAQPGIKSAKRGLKRFVQEISEEYRKGRNGE